MSISRIYELGKRSLLAYQSAIHTTSGNVSNMNNEHYNRRRVEVTNLINIGSGLGITLEQSIRLRQQFAEKQLWMENQHLGKFESYDMFLGQVEDIFAEDTAAGLSNILNEFWNAWNHLANDPESTYARTLVRDKGVQLTDTFQRLHTNLKVLQDQMVPEVQNKVAKVNQIIHKINDINQTMRHQPSADLLDQRDRLIHDLSKIININVKEKDNGEVSLYVEGLILVSDGKVQELSTRLTPQNGQIKLQVQQDNGARTLNINSGELAGLLDIHNNKIPDYLNRLDDLARNIAESVNAVHRDGYNLAGITNIDFFSDTVSGAADFRLNEAVYLDPSLIATRADGEAEGSNSIALAIYNLQFQDLVKGDTAADYYQSMITGIGNLLHENTFQRQSQELIVRQLENRRDAVTGVSLDEEMAKMMQYEQAYEAAARVLRTVDQMVETLLNLRSV